MTSMHARASMTDSSVLCTIDCGLEGSVVCPVVSDASVSSAPMQLQRGALAGALLGLHESCAHCTLKCQCETYSPYHLTRTLTTQDNQDHHAWCLLCTPSAGPPTIVITKEYQGKTTKWTKSS